MTTSPLYLIHNCSKMTKREWLQASVKNSIASQAGRELLLIYSPCVLSLGWLEEWIKIFQVRNINFETYELSGEPQWKNLIECSRIISAKTRIWGIGGGSVMDLAKLVSTGVAECEQKLNFMRPRKLSQKHKVWLFPTHYSSSAYVSSSATLIRDRQKISGVGLTAEKVFVDPNVLRSIPEKVWIYGSIDTVAHFVEILCSTKSSNYLRIMALKGWWKDFLNALQNRDFESLFYLAAFLYNGLFELHSITWPVHHLSHELGPKLELGHGETLGLILPLFVRARLQHPLYERIHELLDSVRIWLNNQSAMSFKDEQLMIFNDLDLWKQKNWFDPNECCNSIKFKRYLIEQIKFC